MADFVAVRPARDTDLPGLLSLYRAFSSFDLAFDAAAAVPRWAAMQATPGLTVLLAEINGTVAASCTLVVVPNLTAGGSPWAVIENVVTHPDHRRQGHGRRVLIEA